MEPTLINFDLVRAYFTDKPVKKAYLFGSFANSTSLPESDVDILVELDYTKPIGLEFVQMKLDLESILNKKVDLVSSNGLSKHIRPFVEHDKVLIYAR
jgi:predicted nucleotidyltransferase